MTPPLKFEKNIQINMVVDKTLKDEGYNSHENNGVTYINIWGDNIKEIAQKFCADSGIEYNEAIEKEFEKHLKKERLNEGTGRNDRQGSISGEDILKTKGALLLDGLGSKNNDKMLKALEDLKDYPEILEFILIDGSESINNPVIKIAKENPQILSKILNTFKDKPETLKKLLIKETDLDGMNAVMTAALSNPESAKLIIESLKKYPEILREGLLNTKNRDGKNAVELAKGDVAETAKNTIESVKGLVNGETSFIIGSFSKRSEYNKPLNYLLSETNNTPEDKMKEEAFKKIKDGGYEAACVWDGIKLYAKAMGLEYPRDYNDADIQRAVIKIAKNNGMSVTSLNSLKSGTAIKINPEELKKTLIETPNEITQIPTGRGKTNGTGHTPTTVEVEAIPLVPVPGFESAYAEEAKETFAKPLTAETVQEIITAIKKLKNYPDTILNILTENSASQGSTVLKSLIDFYPEVLQEAIETFKTANRPDLIEKLMLNKIVGDDGNFVLYATWHNGGTILKPVIEGLKNNPEIFEKVFINTKIETGAKWNTATFIARSSSPDVFELLMKTSQDMGLFSKMLKDPDLHGNLISSILTIYNDVDKMKILLNSLKIYPSLLKDFFINTKDTQNKNTLDYAIEKGGDIEKIVKNALIEAKLFSKAELYLDEQTMKYNEEFKRFINR